MSPTPSSNNTFLGDLRSIYGSWGNTVRALLLLGGIAVIVKYTVTGIWGADVQIEINKEKTIIVKGQTTSNRSNEIAILLLPSTVCWHNSGIELSPHQTAIITASGEIHLGIDKIVEAANKRSIPRYGWHGPEGSDFLPPDTNTLGRGSLLVDASRPMKIGNLLACIVPKNPKHSEIPSIDRPRPDITISDLSKRNEIINESDKIGVIYLTVNDIVLNDDAKDVFLGVKPDKRVSAKKYKDWRNDYIRWEKNWEIIQKNKDWDLFYKDNIGNFLIQIQKKSLE